MTKPSAISRSTTVRFENLSDAQMVTQRGVSFVPEVLLVSYTGLPEKLAHISLYITDRGDYKPGAFYHAERLGDLPTLDDLPEWARHYVTDAEEALS